MRRTSRLLKNVQTTSGHNTPNIISRTNGRSRSCVREYKNKRAFHTSQKFNIQNIESNNNNKNQKQPIEIPNRKNVNTPIQSFNQSSNVQNSQKPQNFSSSNTASSTSSNTSPSPSTSSSASSQISKKYIPEAKKGLKPRIPLADFEKKHAKAPILKRIQGLPNKVAILSKEYGVRIGQYFINIPKHLIWSLRHPIQASQITLQKMRSGKTWFKEAWHHHVVVPYRLGAVDVKEARRIFKTRALEGRNDFTPLEKRKLQAIFADFLKFVPFSVFFVVPFMELLLPFYIKLFPQASPSWFESRDDKEQKIRTKVEFRKSMAEFIQGAMTQYDAQLNAKQEMSLQDFKILQRKLQKGKSVDISELREYIPLFNLHLNLDKLGSKDPEFLMGMCKMLGVPTPPGVSNQPIWLMWGIRRKMKSLRESDAALREIGLGNLSNDDLINENVKRGGRGAGMTREKLENQLNDWILMNYENSFPETLTLVVRASTANAGMVSEPKEIKIAVEREIELEAEKKKKSKEASENKSQIENKLLGQKYSLDIMDLRTHKVSLNDLRAVYRTLEELCDLVNVRDISTNVFSIKCYINDQSTFGTSRKDRMDKMQSKLDNIASKMNKEKEKIAEKVEQNATVETQRGEKVVGHVNQEVVKEMMVKYYGLENAEHRTGLSGYVEMGSNNLNEMLITHVIRAINPENDEAGVNVKMARKALEIELNTITKQDENLAKAVKTSKGATIDFNQPIFTDKNYDLYNIAKTLIEWKLEKTKLDDIIDE